MEGIRASGRRRPVARGRLAGQRRTAGVRLRSDELRGIGRGRSGPDRLPAGTHQDRAVRSDGRTLMEALDGNAIGGVLYRVFGGEMTMTRVECGRCEACGPLAECEVYLGGPGVVVRCRACHTIMMVLVE